MAITAKVKGLSKILKALDKAESDVIGAVRVAQYRKGLSIMADSMKIVPVETGRLRATAFTTVPDADLNMEIGYGTKYGIYVHEIEEAFHAAPTSWKYLEIPVQQHREGYLAWVAKDAAANFRRGRTTISGSRMHTSPQDPGEQWQRSKQRRAKKTGKR